MPDARPQTPWAALPQASRMCEVHTHFRWEFSTYNHYQDCLTSSDSEEMKHRPISLLDISTSLGSPFLEGPLVPCKASRQWQPGVLPLGMAWAFSAPLVSLSRNSTLFWKLSIISQQSLSEIRDQLGSSGCIRCLLQTSIQLDFPRPLFVLRVQ